MQQLTACEHHHSPGLQCRALAHCFTSAAFEGACSGVGLRRWSTLLKIAGSLGIPFTLGTAQSRACGCTVQHSVFAFLRPHGSECTDLFSHLQGFICNSHRPKFFGSLTTTNSLKGPCLTKKKKKKKCRETKSMQFACYRMPLFFLLQCYICVHAGFRSILTSTYSFRELVFCTKLSQKVSTPSSMDSIPWKLFLLFISQKKKKKVPYSFVLLERH